MLEAMLEGWRGKRVLIVGDRGGLCAFLIAVLDEIGARPVCVSDRADAQTLCRALTAGRVSAAILPGEMTGRSLPERLEATLTLTREVREAGVPLLLAMSDAAVYRGGGRMNEAGEIGGRTREGMEASILQTALLGAARELMGDAVRTMLVRHAPVLGEDCAAWCDALLEGRTIRVRHPAARGVFVHPLDIVCCGLTLGAAAGLCYDLLGRLRRGRLTAGAADLFLGALCAAGMTGIALRLRMNPFRLYAFAGVALGLAAYAATLGRLLRFFAARSARLRANPRECVKKVK